jgi:hypothetical protein
LIKITIFQRANLFKMRMEILKFLSDSKGFKHLNGFLKTIVKEGELPILAGVLKDMSISVVDQKNVILISGELQYLSERYFQLDKDLRALSLRTEDPISNLDNTPLKGRITEAGRKELREFELSESSRKVNESVVRTNNITLVIASLAALFSLLAVIAPLLKHDKLSVPEIKETNKLLQRQVQILDSLQQKLNVPDSLRVNHVISLKEK